MKVLAGLSLLVLIGVTSASPMPHSQSSSTTSKQRAAQGSSSSAQTQRRTDPNLRTPVITSVPDRFDQTPPLQGNPYKNATNTTLSAPFTPAGGEATLNPKYMVKSNFDFQSINLGLCQELIELDLFRDALRRFSIEEWEAAGINAADRFLIELMADQEVGHATAFTNMLGPDRCAKQCIYQYPYKTVKEFILFSHLLTRWGESGTLGFIPHLDNRASAQIVLQAITTESRQEMIFRQFQGLFPMPVWFETGLPQAFAWTLLQRYIKSCPSNNPVIEFQIFPDLLVTNQPYLLNNFPAITQNTSGVTSAGRELKFQWENPGKVAGYDNKYKTTTQAGKPKYVAWISQLNVTYTDLYDLNTTSNTGTTKQPGGLVFPGSGDLPGNRQVNETMFIVLTDATPYLTPYNISLINKHVVAGPALYQSG